MRGGAWFGPEDAQALGDFFDVYEAHVRLPEVIERAASEGSNVPPSLFALAERWTPEVALANRIVLRAAIAGDWEPYERALTEEGARWAEHGAIAAWEALDSPIVRVVAPKLVERLASEPARLAAAIVVMHEFLLRVRSTLAAGYAERREQKLRELDHHWRRLVESAMVGVWVFDASGKTTFMNKRMRNMLQVHEEEAVHATPASFIEDLGEEVAAQRLADRKAGIAARYDQKFRRRDGTTAWAVFESSPIRDSAGDFQGVLAIAMDITERKRAADEVRASEERYRLLFENSPLPKWLLDAETLRFLEVNDAAIRTYGWSREEFLALTLEEVRLPEDIATLREGVARVSREAQVLGPFRHKKKDGSTMLVEVTTHAVVVGNRPCRLAVLKDVSVERRLEEQLRQAHKMEAVGRLAGGVAHDFNNALSVVLTYAHLVLAALGPSDPMRADIEEIRKAGLRSAELTRQLLAFSRRQVLEPRVIDLNEVLAGTERMLRRLLREDIELVTRRAPSLGRVRADPGSIDQVLMNLVINARDAMPRGGTLVVETTNVVLDERFAREHLGVPPGEYVALAVTDTGVGMDKSTQARIFEPFFTTKEKGKGTGLGLSTVFGIVQQSGGTIWVYSEVGKGTTFTVYLPSVDAQADDVARPTFEPAGLHGTETILLVEDDDAVRGAAFGILGRHGYRVIEARNAGEALLACEKEPGTIDLLLTDVVMPHTSGPELAARLAKSRTGMRVICMSGYTGDSVFRHGLIDAGMAFMQKPFTPETLTRKVREVLSPRPPDR